jgi:tetratricopeptide (TPR) repeat protein
MKSLKTTMLAAVAFAASVFTAQAQDMAQVKKMFEFGRYATVKKLVGTPSTAEANFYLGLAELGLGHKDEAMAIFGKYPDDMMNQSGKARVLFAQQKNTEAHALLATIAAKAKKKDINPLKYAADAIIASGTDATKAVEWYKRVVLVQPTGDNYMALGDAYMYVADGGGGAATSYEKAIQNKATPSYVYARLGDLWYSAKVYDSAEVNYNRAIAADPTNPLPYYRYSETFYQQRKFDLAKENLEKYIANSDQSSYDKLKLANIYYQMRDFKGAIPRFTALLADGENVDYITKALMFCYAESGDFANALSTMEKYKAMVKPEAIDANDLGCMSKILRNTPGREAEGLDYLRKSIAANKGADNSATYRTIAEEYRDKQDWANAAIWYNDMLASSPEASLTNVDWFYGGFANYASNDNATAIKHLTRMTELFPSEPTGYYYLGTAQAATDKSGAAGTAIAAYTKYIELEGAKAESKDQVGKAYNYLILNALATKNKSKALEFCNKALALDPNNAFAKAKLAEAK